MYNVYISLTSWYKITQDKADILLKSIGKYGGPTVVSMYIVRCLWYLCTFWRCPWCNGNYENGHGKQEFKSWTKLDCISHFTDTLGKGMNLTIFPSAMGKS